MSDGEVALTAQQQAAYEAMVGFVRGKQGGVFILRGYAGTGKTTLIAHLVRSLADELSFTLMAPTGRAAKVLRSKVCGQDVSTIHSSIYRLVALEERVEEGQVRYYYPLQLASGAHSSVYIVDEASMVPCLEHLHELFVFGSGSLMSDLLAYVHLEGGSRLIFVGDPMQLPPVGERASNALEEGFFAARGLCVQSFDLTEVVRQASESAILANATMLRELAQGGKHTQLQLLRQAGEVEDIAVDQVVDSYCEQDPHTAAIICYSNRMAGEYNRLVRARLFPGQPSVQVGDRLMVVSNNYYNEIPLMNGELVTVTQVSDTVERRRVMVGRTPVELAFRKVDVLTLDGKDVCERYIVDTLLDTDAGSLSVDERKAMYIDAKIRLDAIKDLGAAGAAVSLPAGSNSDRRIKLISEELQVLRRDPYYNALQVKYGYAITCHKAQGGEWDRVYVDFWGRQGLDLDALRWKYTAITRARRTLLCANMRDITLVSELRVQPIARATRIPDDARAYAECAPTPFHAEDAPHCLKAKYWSVVRNLKGTPYSVQRVRSMLWMERYAIRGPRGVEEVDIRYNKGLVFHPCAMQVPDEALRALLDEEAGIAYAYPYEPESETLAELHGLMGSLCTELGIAITNVVTGQYVVTYYLRTLARYAAVSFSHNDKGALTSLKPMSMLGEEDGLLQQLLARVVE